MRKVNGEKLEVGSGKTEDGRFMLMLMANANGYELKKASLFNL
jgi:hypothetical protein